jgi:hypothetical protein
VHLCLAHFILDAFNFGAFLKTAKFANFPVPQYPSITSISNLYVNIYYCSFVGGFAIVVADV